MIGDFLKRAIDFARGYLWVSGDSETSDSQTSDAPRRGAGAASVQKGQRAESGATGTPGTASTGRPAAAGKTAAGTASAKAGAKAGTKAGAKTAAKPSPKGASKTAGKAGGKAGQGAAAKASAKATPAKTTKAADTARSKAPANDDLTAIKGIGPALKKDLAGLGVSTIQDLAKADAGDLAGKLSQRTVTPDKVRGWIAEAQRRS